MDLDTTFSSAPNSMTFRADNNPYRRRRFVLRRHGPSSSTGSSSSESQFDYLCEEELVEILQRLPLKLVTRCKSVSKRWFSLISGNYFARSYVRFQTDNNLFVPRLALIQIDLGIMIPLPPPPPPPPPSSDDATAVKLSLDIPVFNRSNKQIRLQYLCTSNGLVLCSPPSCDKDYYFVLNPMTKKRIALPPMPKVAVSDHGPVIGFICTNNDDVAVSNNQNRLANSFRVVRVPPIETPYTDLKLDIFSSETSNWTQSSFPLQKRSVSYDYQQDNVAVACNGKLHWRRLWFETEVFSFDPYQPEDQYQRLSFPKGSKIRGCVYCFGMCNCGSGKKQHLKYTECYDGLIQVWELKDYDKGEWYSMHRVHLYEIESHVPSFHWPPKSLSIFNVPWVPVFHPYDGDVMLCYKFCRILQYNLRTRTLELFLLEDGRELDANYSMLRRFFLLDLPCWPTPVRSVSN